MKREVETRQMIEVPDEGLVKFMGKPVLLMCANYFYAGKLTGINETCVEMSEPSIVYETGAWSDKSWKDAQRLPGAVLIRTAPIW